MFSSSEVDLSAKLMIMITGHEKSIPRGEPEERKPAEGGMGGREGGINLHVSRLFDHCHSAMRRLPRTRWRPVVPVLPECRRAI